MGFQFGRALGTLLCLVCLFGCQGVPLHDLRAAAPNFEVDTARPIDAVLGCLTEHQDVNNLRGAGSLHVTTQPSGQQAEITIGAYQMSDFKHFYLVQLKSIQQGTHLRMTRAPVNFGPLPEDELRGLLSRCAAIE
ncbi:hypothetical protein [Aromatoleum buckelii]|uniref:Lipoprotein n=1 Tax=Aromatoleum buckelii TaxID=200254 RepID=A0ABX1N7F5_9RHOO|nr:hypothetical protein [Aromatoleum buckelii]MCK0510926.1 hypothetical protein [Aromatoleum buckelii]